MKRKIDSILKHFDEYNSFYFILPHYLSPEDQNYLIFQSRLFIQTQFDDSPEISTSLDIIKRRSKLGPHAKELSWELFYRFNNWIRVCDNVFDEGLDWIISGFSGRIIDFYTTEKRSIFLIEFSYDSISKIPLEKLKLISSSASPFYTLLESDFIMPASTPENLQEDEKRRIKLMIQITGNDKYPHKNFYVMSDILQFWKDHIRSYLKKPEKVIVAGKQKTGAWLVDLPYFCERFGVWGTFLIKEKIFDIPLVEIEKCPDNQFLNDLFLKYQEAMKIILPN